MSQGSGQTQYLGALKVSAGVTRPADSASDQHRSKGPTAGPAAGQPPAPTCQVRRRQRLQTNRKGQGVLCAAAAGSQRESAPS